MIGDAGDDVAEIGFRVEAVQLGGLDDGVYDGSAFAASVRAGKKPVLTPNGQRADSTFSGIVTDVETTIGGIASESIPTRERIANGLSESALAADLVQGILELGLYLFQLRHRPLNTYRQALMRLMATNISFNGK